MASLAFPRAMRLRSRSEFQALNRTGLRLRLADLIIRYQPTDRGHPRFGLTVSRRVGNAVCRNRVKRRLRDVIRHHQSSVGSFDVVIIAKPSAALRTRSDFFTQIQSACADALRQRS